MDKINVYHTCPVSGVKLTRKLIADGFCMGCHRLVHRGPSTGEERTIGTKDIDFCLDNAEQLRGLN